MEWPFDGVWKYIFTHESEHFDEWLAIWFLRKFGEGKFPGIKDAKVMHTTTGEKPLGLDAAQCEKAGALCIGINHSDFDDHKPGNEGESAATLVATYLDIVDDPALKPFIMFVIANDANGKGQPGDLANLIYPLYKEREHSFINKWVFFALEVIYKHCQELIQNGKPLPNYKKLFTRLFIKKVMDEQRWSSNVIKEWDRVAITVLDGKTKQYNEAKEEFVKNARVHEIGENGLVCKVAGIESDNPEMSHYCRAREGANCAAWVIRQTSGNTQVFMDKSRIQLDLGPVVARLRAREMGLESNLSPDTLESLGVVGKPNDKDKWYLHHSKLFILNGSKSNTKVPPTSLSLGEIMQALLDEIMRQVS